MKIDMQRSEIRNNRENLSVEDLYKLVNDIYYGFATDGSKLKESICAIPMNDISFRGQHHLHIIGNADTKFCQRFKDIGISAGAYINHHNDWLLLIVSDMEMIENILGMGNPYLESITVSNTDISVLNAGTFPNLKSIALHDNFQLAKIFGLDQLTQLSNIYIGSCDNLFELSGVEKIGQLTNLQICYCDKLYDFSWLTNHTQLTVLHLSGFSHSVLLPNINEMTQLRALALYDCPSLTSLQGLDSLKQLEYLCCMGCSGINALSELAGLSQLTYLFLCNCENLTELDVSGCSGITELMISGCYKLTCIPGLDSLIRLKQLDISGCCNLSMLPKLDHLTQLEKLHISECSSLEMLDLSGCKRLTQLTGLERMPQLTSLNLFMCRSLTQLSYLEQLTQLTRLNISNCRRITALPGLDKLYRLTDLNLAGCEGLTNIPNLGELTRLTYLNLSSCRKLLTLPGLINLPNLTELKLRGCEKLTCLPPLDRSSRLTILDIHGCENLADLPELGKLVSLEKIDLSKTAISIVPDGIRNMSKIRKLNLSLLHLKSLPEWLPDIAESINVKNQGGKSGEAKAIVYLGKTIVDGMDMSIFEQPYEMVVKWFDAQKLGKTQPLNEIKVVFLGDGEAGKSYTIARLMNDGGAPDHAVFDGQSTPGIVIRNKEYDLGDRKIQVHYWDFGGQEIMHSMHRIFLTGRTMYVILLNARDDTQSDRAKYWLHNVKSFAPDAPVLLVLNKIDQNENASVDEPDLRNRCNKLTQVVRLSAKDFTQEEFNNCFTDVLLEEIQKTGYLDVQWPTTWTKVKDRLEHMETHYITGSDYQTICTDCQVDDNQKNLLHWFNDLGVSFCCDGEDDYTLEDYVILRPDWITNALYIILFNALEGARNGLIPHRSIYNLLRNAHANPEIRCTLPQASYTAGDIGYVLGIMRKFNLSFTDGQNNEFVPMLCQQNSMVDVQYYQKDAEILEFNMEFDYLPNNLLHRLMVERYSELDMATVWRTGARFQLKELGYSAVVVIDGNTLRFFIRHTDSMHRPNTYLTMLKAHVERIVEKMGLKAPICQLIYKLDGKRDEFEYEMLKGMKSIGQTMAYSREWRRMLPIQDILNQSAPDNLDDEKKLLDRIVQACGNIQDEPSYHLVSKSDGHGYVNGQGMEDLRNRRIRDNLMNAGYPVNDQTQRGISSSGKSVGELDMLVYNDSNEPWTIIEALRVSDKDKSEWNKHLKKLTDNYNTRGFPALYLLAYVDADTATFKQIWQSYQDHIKTHHPGQLKYSDGSFVELDIPNHQYIKVAKCRYTGGVDPITVYHIFAYVPLKN